MYRLASCDFCYYRYALVLTRLYLGHALSVTVYITWVLVTLLFFYPQILACHALSLSVSCDSAFTSRSLSCICILVTLSFLRDFTLVTLYMSRSLSLISRHCAGPLHTRFYLCHGPYNVTVVHYCVVVSTRCHFPHVTWPVFLYVTVRFALVLCSVTLLLKRDVTTL